MRLTDRTGRLAATSLLVGVAFGSFSDATAQSATRCAAPGGVAPTGITIANTAPSVTVQWNAVAGARGYAVVRRNPDGTCWLLTSRSTATSIAEPLPPIGGIYQYQIAVQTLRGSGASEWFPFTVPPAAISSRTFSLTGFTATGTGVAIASRTFSLAGFVASGSAVPVASRTLLLTGFTANGSSVAVGSRTFSLVGFTASGTSSAVAARTITTPGWTATGQSQP